MKIETFLKEQTKLNKSEIEKEFLTYLASNEKIDDMAVYSSGETLYPKDAKELIVDVMELAQEYLFKIMEETYYIIKK